MTALRRLADGLRLHLLSDQFPALHGLRALAIVSVLQVHVSLTFLFAGFLREEDALFLRSTNVWFGMDLFFVLSGFLIGSLLLPEARASSRGGLRRFYLRRLFRIVPLYYVVLAALAATSPLEGGALAAQRSTLPFEFAYLTNYAAFTVPPVMPWAWSLCVEEHFYLVVPLLAAVLAQIARPNLRLATLGLLWLAGLAVRWAVFASRPSWTANEMTFDLYTRTHTRFDVLVAGVFLAHLQHQHRDQLRSWLRARWARLALGAVPVACAAALLGPLARRQDLATVFAWGTVTSVMYVALVVLLLDADTRVSRFLGSRWFLRYATLGYGIYLVHPPVIGRLVAPAAGWMLLAQRLPMALVWPTSLALVVVLSAAIAYGLHLVIEKPALWLRDRVT